MCARTSGDPCFQSLYETEYARSISVQRAFHTVVQYSLPWKKISPLLARELTQDAVVILSKEANSARRERDKFDAQAVSSPLLSGAGLLPPGFSVDVV
jgi:hypothetical protein